MWVFMMSSSTFQMPRRLQERALFTLYSSVPKLVGHQTLFSSETPISVLKNMDRHSYKTMLSTYYVPGTMAFVTALKEFPP